MLLHMAARRSGLARRRQLPGGRGAESRADAGAGGWCSVPTAAMDEAPLLLGGAGRWLRASALLRLLVAACSRAQRILCMMLADEALKRVRAAKVRDADGIPSCAHDRVRERQDRRGPKARSGRASSAGQNGLDVEEHEGGGEEDRSASAPKPCCRRLHRCSAAARLCLPCPLRRLGHLARAAGCCRLPHNLARICAAAWLPRCARGAREDERQNTLKRARAAPASACRSRASCARRVPAPRRRRAQAPAARQRDATSAARGQHGVSSSSTRQRSHAGVQPPCSGAAVRVRSQDRDASRIPGQDRLSARQYLSAGAPSQSLAAIVLAPLFAS
jgi:hypothetical protein